MEWQTLLCDARLERQNAETQKGRSPFQVDIDRIVFSSAFRRLAHKTQVHPLADNDHVHTRLTHSIEVASVGRSLGTMVGEHVANISSDTLGYIVQAACLAHDIGNPPFGHSGEEAISEWFRDFFQSEQGIDIGLLPCQRNDLENFDGNAQGFRILTQLENNKWAGGLQLTLAVLATFSKYPSLSPHHPPSHEPYIGCKKVGIFQSEKRYFEEVAVGTGLMANERHWCRHPLAFLVEAADDICYAVIDIEDGYELGYITFGEAEEILQPLANNKARMPANMSEREKVAKWRAVAIGELVRDVADVFTEKQQSILDGTFSEELINLTLKRDLIKKAKSVAKQKIYWSERKTKIEVAGHEIISGLLRIFVPLVTEIREREWNDQNFSGYRQKCARLILPDGFRGVTGSYEALLRITDFISGMTDRFALELYRKLKGISV